MRTLRPAVAGGAADCLLYGSPSRCCCQVVAAAAKVGAAAEVCAAVKSK